MAPPDNEMKPKLNDSPSHIPGLPPIPLPPRGIPPALEKHIVAVKWLFAVYAAGLALFWYQLVAVGHDQPIVTGLLWVGGLAYCVLIVECTIIQGKLFEAGLYKHRSWQVIVGALFLNPCFLGWWIPVSILLAVRRAR